MRKILFGLGALIGLIIVAALIAPMIISGSFYKEQIELQASKALGRTVTIADDPQIRIFPAPAFTVEDLQISNAEGMTAANFASVRRADIGVKLMPLLGKNVEIQKFSLIDPVINLEKNAQGDVNWLLGSPTEAPAKPTKDSSSLPISDLKLGVLTIENGAIAYLDQVKGQTFEAKNADITIKMASLSKPLSLNGEMILQEAPTKIDLKLTTPEALLAQQQAHATIALQVGDNAVETDLVLGEGTLNYQGKVNVAAPQLRQLMQTLGVSVATETGFNALFVSGVLTGTAERMSFDQATLQFDEIKGTGTVAFDMTGNRPKLSGTATLDLLDLRPYMPAAAEKSTDAKAPFPAWSEEKIDFAALKAIDVDLKTETAGILLPTMQFDRSALDLTINNGVMTADLQALNMYDGTGTGRVQINGRSRTPALAASFTLGSLNAQAFARDVLKMDRVKGIGNVTFDLTTKGNNQLSMMQSLTGSGDFTVNEGALNGVNLGKLVRTASAIVSGFEGGSFKADAFTNVIAEAKGPEATTDFSAMQAPFTISQGVAETENILLNGPYFEIKGIGKVNLPLQTVDMTLTPLLTGEGENASSRSILPILISGTFSNPKIGIDTKKIIQSLAASKGKKFLESQGIKTGDADNVEDLVKDAARDRLRDALGLGGSKKDKDDTSKEDTDASTDAAPETDDAASEEEAAPEEEEKSVEDELKEKALDAIFGGKG